MVKEYMFPSTIQKVVFDVLEDFPEFKTRCDVNVAVDFYLNVLIKNFQLDITECDGVRVYDNFEVMLNDKDYYKLICLNVGCFYGGYIKRGNVFTVWLASTFNMRDSDEDYCLLSDIVNVTHSI